jgi:hypothetical protein
LRIRFNPCATPVGESARERQPLGRDVDRYELARRLRFCHLDHEQPYRPYARNRDHVVQLDVAAVDRVDRASQRLDHRSVI